MDSLSKLLENVHLYATKYYRIDTLGHWSYTLTRKDTILFYLVISGGFCIEVNGEARKAHMGDMIMLTQTSCHASYSLDYNANNAKPIDDELKNNANKSIKINGQDSPNAIASSLMLIECHYDKEVTRPLLTALPSMLPNHQPNNTRGRAFLETGVKVLTIESQNNRIGKMAVINRTASIILIECVRQYIESLPDATDNWLLALKDPYLAKALAAMHDSPNHGWTINSLAEVAGMSRSSFAERFRSMVGVPPLTYLTDYRLRLASRYLRLHQNSISQISEMVGYASDSTFSQAFKRVFGVSPRAYRQAHENEQD